VYFEIQNTMRWSEGDTVKFVTLLRIHFLTHNLRGRNCSSPIKLFFSSVKYSGSCTRTFSSRTIFEREIRPRKEFILSPWWRTCYWRGNSTCVCRQLLACLSGKAECQVSYLH